MIDDTELQKLEDFKRNKLPEIERHSIKFKNTKYVKWETALRDIKTVQN